MAFQLSLWLYNQASSSPVAEVRVGRSRSYRENASCPAQILHRYHYTTERHVEEELVQKLITHCKLMEPGCVNVCVREKESERVGK